jgi:uncharacterized membrane protein
MTLRPHRPGTFVRGSTEFARVLAFSDGIFAIAMTLLVAGISVPSVPQAELLDALLDRWDDLLAFFLSFAVIGFYWLAHHAFFALLGALDTHLVRLNLFYLGLIAFLPFPTALIGRYDRTAVAVGLYAAVLAVASGLETIMFRRARNAGALLHPVPDDAYRHYVMRSLAPCVVFAASMPLALIHPIAAMLSWMLIFPIERLLRRFAPDSAVAWAEP